MSGDLERETDIDSERTVCLHVKTHMEKEAMMIEAEVGMV
jgi:hypothetical protein